MRCLPLAVRFLLLSLTFLPLPNPAQAVLPQSLYQGQNSAPHSLLGTEISDIKWGGRYLWVATERGLARLDPRVSSGLLADEWVTFTEEQGLGRGAVSAVDAVGDTVWVATIADTSASGSATNQQSTGLSFSVDGGEAWKNIPNQSIFAGFLRGPTTPIDNLCYGLSLAGNRVWAAFFAGSLVRSPDHGQSWERVLPDGAKAITYYATDTAGAADSLRAQADSLARAGGSALQIAELQAQADSLNTQPNLHRTFAVLAYGDTVWVGTASGIARSFDNGQTWSNLKARLDAQGNLLPGNIAGNWVVALERQILPDGRSAIWAGTRSTGNTKGEREAISRSFDNGQTWQSSGPSSAWDFAFTADKVWAGTDQGLYASADQGATWEQAVVRDQITGEDLHGTFVGLETVGQVLWAGAENGLGRSEDGGQTWAVIKSLVRPLSLDKSKLEGQGGLVDSLQTYAAPNPFAPSQDEKARMVYSLSKEAQVTIEIYDFASRKVRTLISGAMRQSGNQTSDAWDGKDDGGDTMANGVYFYRIELDSGQQAFGKVVVLD